MKASGITRLRLHNQRLMGAPFRSPVEAVRWFGAVQAQELPSSLYAIGLRTKNATEASVEQAIASGTIVRTWPMRRTIHCMTAEDARWMIRLLAPRGIARMQHYHQLMGITDDHLDRAGKIFESVLARKTQLTRAELYQHLDAAGIPIHAPPRGPMRGSHLLVHWAQAGLICLAARKGKQPTFALLDDWIPRGRDLSGDDALAELARIYFRAHAPATVKDFCWWSGLPMAEAKRAVMLIGDLLKSTRVDGVEYWLLRNASPPSDAALPVLLLPAFDEYTVAYSDRSVAAGPSVLGSIGHGLFPNILVDGRIAGTWKRTLRGNGAVEVKLRLLRTLNKKEQAGLASAVERYAAFLGHPLAPEEKLRKPGAGTHKGQLHS